MDKKGENGQERRTVLDTYRNLGSGDLDIGDRDLGDLDRGDRRSWTPPPRGIGLRLRLLDLC